MVQERLPGSSRFRMTKLRRSHPDLKPVDVHHRRFSIQDLPDIASARIRAMTDPFRRLFDSALLARSKRVPVQDSGGQTACSLGRTNRMFATIRRFDIDTSPRRHYMIKRRESPRLWKQETIADRPVAKMARTGAMNAMQGDRGKLQIRLLIVAGFCGIIRFKRNPARCMIGMLRQEATAYEPEKNRSMLYDVSGGTIIVVALLVGLALLI